MAYQLKNIFDLLNALFNENDLRTFCLVEPGFRPVHELLHDTDRKPEILRRLLDHADHTGQLDRLLAWAESSSGEQFQRFQPYVVVDKSNNPANIFISYKRNASPDEPLAERLAQALEQAGHTVFIDQKLLVGVAWADEIRRQIQRSDFVMVLLSEASVHSEMVADEIAYAFERHRETGHSRLLPIRVNYTAPLPYALSHYLEPLQYAMWRDDSDTAMLLNQLLAAVQNRQALAAPSDELAATGPEVSSALPQPSADPRFIETLIEPGGAERVRSEFYVIREGDRLVSQELGKVVGATITIRAPRQTGKSSLLIRGVQQARQQGKRVVAIDLQPVDKKYLASLDSFLRYLAEVLVARLLLDPAMVERAWQSALGASDKLTYLLEGYILPEIAAPLVLAIDEADKLLQTTFHDTFFGLLRFWHNSRAMNETWDNLDLIMAISTEPHLLISDVSQSPFNVGTRIRLHDFEVAQVADLNRRYRSPLAEAELPAFMEFFNGHPYLTRKALYTMVSHGVRWVELTSIATGEDSPFGDHLRRYFWLISQQPELGVALSQVIQRGTCPDEVTFYRLLQAGLVSGGDSRTCQPRCGLYERYLKDRL